MRRAVTTSGAAGPPPASPTPLLWRMCWVAPDVALTGAADGRAEQTHLPLDPALAAHLGYLVPAWTSAITPGLGIQRRLTTDGTDGTDGADVTGDVRDDAADDAADDTAAADADAGGVQAAADGFVDAVLDSAERAERAGQVRPGRGPYHVVHVPSGRIVVADLGDLENARRTVRRLAQLCVWDVTLPVLLRRFAEEPTLLALVRAVRDDAHDADALIARHVPRAAA